MGSCIICGVDVDGAVCQTHQQDVAFEFEGSHASELTADRFYRGEVDGFADFGVFVNIGDNVTGLLHRSELPKRIESIDLEVGDSVYVKVTAVRDNGDVDLAWSIRQSESEFRGTIVDSPSGEEVITGGKPASEPSEDPTEQSTPTQRQPEPTTSPDRQQKAQQATTTLEVKEVSIDALPDHVGGKVAIDGTVTAVRQTPGPTIFVIEDETDAVDCAAFEGPGTRAYPDIDTGDAVAVTGEVTKYDGRLQIESEEIEVLDSEATQELEARRTSAKREKATPEEVELLAEDSAVTPLTEELKEAATSIRSAVFEGRPIVVRHRATVDGSVAGAALERAVVPMLEEQHDREGASFQLFERRPVPGRTYDMSVATDDVTDLLEREERYEEQSPLLILIGLGTDAGGLEFATIYDVEAIALDDVETDEPHADLSIQPASTENPVTHTVLAANLALYVNSAARESLGHLPAISFWEDCPETYASLAGDTGLATDSIQTIREAICLQAYYQAYEDKRELVEDLLFEGPIDADSPGAGLAATLSEEYRRTVDRARSIAVANREMIDLDDGTVVLLDTDAYSDRFSFPPRYHLLSVLHRESAKEVDGPVVTLGVDRHTLEWRTDIDLDLQELAAAIADAVPNAGIEPVGGPHGTIEFLAGERDAVIDATLEIIGERLV